MLILRPASAFPPLARRDAHRTPAQIALSESVSIVRALEALDHRRLLRRRRPRHDDTLITIAVPMRNVASYIEVCLKGLLSQTHRNFEAFCVDDASDDDTYETARRLVGDDGRFCLVRLAERVGPYQIKNWIIARLARGAFVAMQDADDVSHPRRLELQRRWMLRRGYAVTGTCVHQFYPPSLKPRFESPPAVSLDASPYQHSRALYQRVPLCPPELDLETLLGPLRREFIAKHGSQMFRRELLLAFGGFDGHTRFGADTDLNWRLLRWGPIENLPRILYSRRFHHDSLTMHPATGWQSEARRRYMEARDRRHALIVQALARGDRATARELSIRDLYFGDVRVATGHSRFIPLDQLRTAAATSAPAEPIATESSALRAG